jgi:hypothetical protein
VSNSTHVPPWAVHATQLSRPFEAPPRCKWHSCHGKPFEHLGLCFDHSAEIFGQMELIYRARLEAIAEATPPPPPSPNTQQPVVYYLILGPTTVKIGTTKNLGARVRQLRTDLQYVVAVEWGGRDLERQRHLEFADERFGAREDFLLSDRLKARIESLQPRRDEIISLAAQPGGYRWPHPPA